MLKTILDIGIPILILVVCWIVGVIIDKRNKKYLDRREQELSGIIVSGMKKLPENWECVDGKLVVGAAVVGNNYFKSFLAMWVNLFGGEMTSYQKILEYGRRLATVRMLEEAQRLGADVVWNVRLETSTLQGKGKKQNLAGVELVAYGTAVKIRR